MIKFRGLVEKQIGENKVIFQFDMASIEMLGDMQNLGVGEILKSGGRSKLSTLSCFLYTGAVRYCNKQHKEIKFTREDATDWVEILGIQVVLQMFLDFFTTPEHEVKNDKVTVKENGPLQTQDATQ